jgi:hypothetical protein
MEVTFFAEVEIPIMMNLGMFKITTYVKKVISNLRRKQAKIINR